MKDSLKEKVLLSDEVDNSVLAFFDTKKDRYLYGNGEQTAIALLICQILDVEIKGILLPPGSDLVLVNGRWGRLLRRANVFQIGEIEFPENTFVMMACDRGSYKEVEKVLNSMGFMDVIGCLWYNDRNGNGCQMKRALITTLHFYDNFGSVLQAYALKETLYKQLDIESDFFPYRPSLPQYKYFTDPRLITLYEDKKAKFATFRRKYLGISGESVGDISTSYQILGRKPQEYEAFIVGSDIVWGKEFSNLDGPYFLRHALHDRPRVAYAASIVLDSKGHTENDDLVREGVNNLSAIGMREPSSIEPIKKLVKDIDVSYVLDPTLLLDKKDYSCIEEKPSFDIQEPYILSYFLTHDPAVVDYTNIIAKKFGIRVVHFFADYPKRVFGEDSECFTFAGPGEFLSLVKNASLIFTNSFHGTCFSIAYCRPFYTYMAKRNLLSRVRDMIDLLEMNDRCFCDFDDLKRISMDIDYSSADVRLLELRRKSLTFLKNALEG